MPPVTPGHTCPRSHLVTHAPGHTWSHMPHLAINYAYMIHGHTWPHLVTHAWSHLATPDAWPHLATHAWSSTQGHTWSRMHGHTLWKLRTGREPFKWLPLSFSSAMVWTAGTEQAGDQAGKGGLQAQSRQAIRQARVDYRHRAGRMCEKAGKQGGRQADRQAGRWAHPLPAPPPPSILSSTPLASSLAPAPPPPLASSLAPAPPPP